MTDSSNRNHIRPEVRWTVGCLVATAAMVGLLVLVLLVAIALEPPQWIQILLGAGLAVGGALLAWVVAAALGASRESPAQTPEGPTSLEERRQS